MLITTKHTWRQSIWDARLFEIAQESGRIYSSCIGCMEEFIGENSWFPMAYDMQKMVYHKHTSLTMSASSKIGVIQKFSSTISGYKTSKKRYDKNPSIFNGAPKLPYKKRFLYPIPFKDGDIIVRKEYLEFRLSKGNAPIKLKWNEKLNKPIYAEIFFSQKSGWQVSMVFNTEKEIKSISSKKSMSIDLGIKRIATTFNEKTKEIKTYSGKYVMSLVRLRNKKQGKTQSKLSKKKKGSKNYKDIKRAERKVNSRIDNQINDCLHKYSKQIVDECIKNKIKEIIIGDCSSIHDGTNLGKKNNQQVQQGTEQKLKRFIEYKMNDIGGTLRVVPEHYTSKKCPYCGELNTPSNRTYKCKTCKFTYDRDGVGALNIYKNTKNVSRDKMLRVVGSLTEPIGVKYRDCPKIYLGRA